MNYLKDPFDYQVLNLTDKFYDDYPLSTYTELAHKKARPYNCLLIQSRYGYFICIPYRSHINHKYSFKFKNSIRSKKNNSGLDYSKTVIITNPDYIGSKDAIVDKDEFIETVNNLDFIKNNVQEYIDNYVNHVIGTSSKFDEKEFHRIYRFSTLPYFHKELNINSSS